MFPYKSHCGQLSYVRFRTTIFFHKCDIGLHKKKQWIEINLNLPWFIVDQTQLGVMLSKLLGAEKQKFHNSTRYCESIIKFAGIKQIAVQPHMYDQHLSQFWKYLVKYFRTGRPIQTDNSNGMGGGRTTECFKINPSLLGNQNFRHFVFRKY